MSGLGIIAAGLAGGAQAVENTATSDIQNQHQSELLAQRDAAEIDKLKAAEALKLQYENEARNALQARRATASTGIVDAAMNAAYGGSDAAVAAAQAGQTDAPMTPEQLAAIQMSKDRDRKQLMTDPRVIARADLVNGDLNPTTLATTNERLAAQEARSATLAQIGATNAAARVTVGAGNNAAAKYGADKRGESAAARTSAYQQVAKDRIAALNPGDKAIHNQLVANTAAANQLSTDVRALQALRVGQSKADQANTDTMIAGKNAQIKAYRDKNSELTAAAPAAAAVVNANATDAAAAAVPTPADTPASGGGSKAVSAALSAFNDLMGQ